MEYKHHWKAFFQHHKYPCYIRDLETGKILYANDEFFSSFECDESIFGKSFHEIIIVDDETLNEIKYHCSKKEDYTHNFFHKKTNTTFCASAHIMPTQDTVFCEFQVLVNNETIFEKAIAKCMEIYNNSSDIVLPSFLKLLSEHYNSEKSYVYHLNRKDGCLYSFSCFCSENSPNLLYDVIDAKNSSILIELIRNQPNGILSINKKFPDFNDTTFLKSFSPTFDVNNFVLCLIEDLNHKTIGILGLSNLNNFNSSFDSRVIKTISRFAVQEVLNSEQSEVLLQIAQHDSLTGLHNRAGFTSFVENISKISAKHIGIVSININGLRQINLKDGNIAGDNHIKKATSIFTSYLDFEFFRLSGDEFIGIAIDISKNDFETKVFSLHDNMRQESNYDFSLGHSWGYVNDLTKLQLEADTIMYINKQEYYSSSKRNFDAVDNIVLSNLLQYLKDEEFMIYLQPQVKLKDSSLYGAEALIRRFDKKNQKMVFPDQFISLYEQKSVIRHVDLFVVESVCKLIQKWSKLDKSIPISVNLSRVTLQEYGIVDSIVKICDKYDIPHNLLVIEVTERVGLIENNVASALIQMFQDNGFNISLDDFGCAYSNIVTLAQIEVNEVKIDKSLVDFLTTNKKNHILVKNVLSMCNELDSTSTLAEGIEDETQAKLLLDLGCHLGQGYYYSRPISVSDFEEKYIN